jgi:hypothetical protein
VGRGLMQFSEQGDSSEAIFLTTIPLRLQSLEGRTIAQSVPGSRIRSMSSDVFARMLWGR